MDDEKIQCFDCVKSKFVAMYIYCKLPTVTCNLLNKASSLFSTPPHLHKGTTSSCSLWSPWEEMATPIGYPCSVENSVSHSFLLTQTAGRILILVDSFKHI